MTKPDLSLVERLLHRAEQTELRAPYADAPASEALPRMEAMLADAKLDREAADALAEQAAVREELCGALRGLVADVADYDAWARPCHALDVARAALAKAAPETGERNE